MFIADAQRRSCAIRVFCWCCSLLLSFAGLSAHANVPPQEAQAGQLLTRAQEGEPWQQSVHLRSDVDVRVSGMVVEVDYRQTFKNDSNEWREAIYVLPLAEQAAVYSLSMTIGERQILGQIKEKAQAQKIYQQAKREGKKAALLDQQRPNLFTQKIANIGPGESVSIHIQYSETAQFSDGYFSWRLPTTLTPRYMPGAPIAATKSPADTVLGFGTHGWALPTTQVTDAHKISPLMTLSSGEKTDNPISIAVTLAAGLPLAEVNALYHDIAVNKAAGAHHIRLRQASVPMDRDFVLQWRPVAASTPSAAVFKQQFEGDDYAMLMVLPPAGAEQAALPRDLVFVMDTSGSMQGESIKQAKAALVQGIEQLGPKDRFNIIEFNSAHRLLFSGLREANSMYKQQALAWVESLRASGGTEMLPALSTALTALNSENQSLKQLVFITDGAVGNEAELFRTINQHLGDSRLFTVGIGSAPNSFFMRKAAQFGRGTFTYIGAAQEVAARMDELFDKLGSAAAANVQLAWPMAVEQYPQRVPDIYRGEPLTVFIKTSSLNGEAIVAGELAANPLASAAQAWQQKLDLNALATATDSSGIARLWARKKVEALQDQQHTGASAGVAEQILALGLAHQLVTPYTSFVAVEQAVSRPAEQDLEFAPVPNLVAKGQALQPQTARLAVAQTIAYPATATSLALSLWFGLIASIAALAFHFLPTRRLRGDSHELA